MQPRPTRNGDQIHTTYAGLRAQLRGPIDERKRYVRVSEVVKNGRMRVHSTCSGREYPLSADFLFLLVCPLPSRSVTVTVLHFSVR
jgi:hypothetical protein